MREIFKYKQVENFTLRIWQCFYHFQQLLVRHVLYRLAVDIGVIVLHLFVVSVRLHIPPEVVVHRIDCDSPHPAFKRTVKRILPKVPEYFKKRIIQDFFGHLVIVHDVALNERISIRRIPVI